MVKINLVGALIIFNDASVVHRQLCTQSPGCVHVKDANLQCDLDMASLNTRPCIKVTNFFCRYTTFITLNRSVRFEALVASFKGDDNYQMQLANMIEIIKETRKLCINQNNFLPFHNYERTLSVFLQF